MARKKKTSQNVISLLEKAASTTDHAAQLDLLLDAWAIDRASAIRKLVTDVSALALASVVPPSRNLTPKEWDALYKPRRAIDVPALASAMVGLTPTEALRRLKALVKLAPADPRLIDAIVDWFGEPPCKRASEAGADFWEIAFDYLESSSDHALRPKLLALLDNNHEKFWVISFVRPAIIRQTKILAKLVEPELSPERKRAIDDVAKAIEPTKAKAKSTSASKQKNEADLLADIYEAPNDDAPRLVYADWLQERGDPWGELIVLQIAQASDQASGKETPPKTQARIDTLIAKHGEARYEGMPFEWKVRYEGSVRPVRFARGFAIEGEMWNQRGDATKSGDPRWGTFERIRLHNTHDIEAYVDPAKRALRSVMGLGWNTATEIAKAKSRPPQLDELGIETAGWTTGTPDEIFRFKPLADTGFASWAKSLVVETSLAFQPDAMERFMASTLAKKLPRFSLTGARWFGKKTNTWIIMRDRTTANVHVDLLKKLGDSTDRLREIVVLAAPDMKTLSIASRIPMSKQTKDRLANDLAQSSKLTLVD